MSMRAAKYSRIKHPGEMDVTAISSLPGDALYGINARSRMADRLEGSESGSLAHRAPPLTLLETAATRRLFVVETLAPDVVVAVALLVADAANTAST
jgi:hypothetical protein